MRISKKYLHSHIHDRLSMWLSGKEFSCSTGDMSFILGSGRFPGEGNGNLLQYSCLGNPMDRGAWQAYSHWGHKESDVTERLNNSSL